MDVKNISFIFLENGYINIVHGLSQVLVGSQKIKGTQRLGSVIDFGFRIPLSAPNFGFDYRSSSPLKKKVRRLKVLIVSLKQTKQFEAFLTFDFRMFLLTCQDIHVRHFYLYRYEYFNLVHLSFFFIIFYLNFFSKENDNTYRL